MAYDGSSPKAKELTKPSYFVVDPAILEGPKGEFLFSITDFKNSYTEIRPIESFFPDMKESLLAMSLLQEMQKKVAKHLYKDLYEGKYSGSSSPKDYRNEADYTIQHRLDRKRKPTSHETKVIHHAIILLDHHKDSWCQGMAEDHTGRVCLVGALNKTTNAQDMLDRLNFEAGRQARARYKGEWKAGHHFNDDPLTNKSMVLHVLLDTFESLGGRYA